MKMKLKIQKSFRKQSLMKRQQHQQQEPVKKVQCFLSPILTEIQIVFLVFLTVQQFYFVIFDVFFLDNISAAEEVVCEPEEVRGAAEGNTTSAVSDATEQVSEMSSERGECLKTCNTTQTKRTRCFFLFLG